MGWEKRKVDWKKRKVCKELKVSYDVIKMCKNDLLRNSFNKD